MKKTAVSLAVAFCAMAATTAAHADQVTFSGYAHGSETVSYQLLTPNAPVSGSASAGGFSTRLNGGPTFESYCVDLYQTISFGTPYNDYTRVDGGHTFATTHAYADLSRLFAYAGPIVDAVHEAAFQMAVWEIAYETGAYNLADGSARFGGSDGAVMLASSWLNGLANRPLGPSVGVLDSLGQQDVIYAPVPEPSEIALMLTGLVAMAGVARRRRAKKAD